MAKFGETIIISNDYVNIGERKFALINAGLEKIIVQAKQEAQSLVRVDTTTLQKSIAYRKVGLGMYELYASANYAIYQEYGFHHYGTGNWVYPQPFINPAARTAANSVQKMIAAIMAGG